MISYELAKQLKDAGFPQQVKEGDWFYIADGKQPCLITELGYNYESDVKIPTLEELIEACQDLNHDYSFDLECTREGDCWAEIRYFGAIVRQTKGVSPTEVVARLWLALHANGDVPA